MKTSYTKLSTYIQCPQKYKFTYIDKLSKQFEKYKPAMIFGSIMHTALASIFHDVEAGKRNQSVMIEKLKKLISSDPALTEEDKSKYLIQGSGIIEDFIKNNSLDFQPKFVEKYIEVYLPGKKHVISGRIDRIDLLQNNEYEIIDYKTARFIPSELAIKADLQFSIYIYLVKSYLNIDPTHVSYIYLNPYNKISLDYDPEKYNNDILSVIGLIEKIEADTKYIGIESDLCHYCDYLYICPKMGVISITDDVDMKQIGTDVKYIDIVNKLLFINNSCNFLSSIMDEIKLFEEAIKITADLSAA